MLLARCAHVERDVSLSVLSVSHLAVRVSRQLRCSLPDGPQRGRAPDRHVQAHRAAAARPPARPIAPPRRSARPRRHVARGRVSGGQQARHHAVRAAVWRGGTGCGGAAARGGPQGRRRARCMCPRTIQPRVLLPGTRRSLRSEAGLELAVGGASLLVRPLSIVARTLCLRSRSRLTVPLDPAPSGSSRFSE